MIKTIKYTDFNHLPFYFNAIKAARKAEELLIRIKACRPELDIEIILDKIKEYPCSLQRVVYLAMKGEKLPWE